MLFFMDNLLEQIGICIERGKVDMTSPFPPDLTGQEGADEYTRKALEAGTRPDEILLVCNDGMKRIGEKFSRNEVFVPELLMAAKAMNAVMVHLEPFFKAGDIETKGTVILGTVAGDLHDIGKNLVKMVIEGNGWEVIDLGVDVKASTFLSELEKHPGSILGLSALLTTTIANMEATVKAVKEQFPETLIMVGGAPVTQELADKMQADAYASDPQKAVDALSQLSKR